MDVLPIINLLAVAVLIALTAFFVMAEFAIVKIRSTQLEPHIEVGKKSAIAAKRVITHLDEYLSACQLGITITALGIGRLAEPTFEKMLHPVISYFNISTGMVTTIAIVISFLIATFLHVVIGELAPKTIAIQKAEQVTLFIARPLVWFYRLLYPFIWLLNGTARLIIRAMGFKPISSHEETHTEEELRLILADSYKSGEINQAEMMYVNNIFEFDERVAREIMVPRTEMVYFLRKDSLESNLDVILDGQYTRYPVADEDKDNIIGLVNLKEILSGYHQDKNVTTNQFIRPILHVSEATPIKQVLLKMQKERIHMAIVNDEYGGTAGLITVEDILEEIVGDIRDEFDEDEIPDVQEVNDKTVIVSGKLHLEDVKQILGIELDDDEVDTIGGWMFTTNLDAQEGVIIEYKDHRFVIEEMDGYQIKKVKIIKP
ncbi:hemolysin family protein [Oceanobacillus alkalisoli]|uniref:hemolysin family protein n=1 Tax=Oceanobacillus alkalisoli TaxID=2925113 RepID=UPI001EF059BB|nr:hemolysin family protein [Oceanobacillus alkalisoli]MCF3943219.1 hemolysin family protein [Oceanobacillus alkalisoli]MCG5103903.1 hemolysin family protein [Oceanobacillus alkalisoli]